MIDRLKEWKGSNMWTQLKQINILLRKTLRGDGNQRMLVIIRCRIMSSSFLFKINVYGSIILPVVLYGCETWSLTLRGVRSLRMFENSVLNIIFGSMRDSLTREWLKHYNLELSNLNFRPNIVGVIKSRRMKWPGHLAGVCEEKCLQAFVVKPEGKRPHERHRHRWEDNVKMVSSESGMWGH